MTNIYSHVVYKVRNFVKMNSTNEVIFNVI